jgi:hypothetical protein
MVGQCHCSGLQQASEYKEDKYDRFHAAVRFSSVPTSRSKGAVDTTGFMPVQGSVFVLTRRSQGAVDTSGFMPVRGSVFVVFEKSVG